MPAYEVLWERPAERALRGIPRDVQERVLDAVGNLANDPRPRGAQKLKGRLEALYRIRIGIHYRIAYEVDDRARTVRIVKVGSRESIY